MKRATTLLFLLLVVWTVIPGHASGETVPTLTIGTATAMPGGKITIPITLAMVPGVDLAGFDLRLNYDTTMLENPVLTAGPASEEAGKDLSKNTTVAGQIVMMVIGFNTTSLGDGVVVSMTFDVKQASPWGRAALAVSQVTGTTPDAMTLTMKAVDGAVLVGDTIKLSAGWNFISFPRLPVSTATASLLADVSSLLRVVWGFDNSGKKWLRYTPSTTCPSSTGLCTIEAGKGYWVYMDGPAELALPGDAVSGTVELEAGWNLVGYAGLDGATPADSLSTLSVNWDLVWCWENETWLLARSSSAATWASSLTELKQKKAYWVKVNGPTTWAQ